MKTYQFLYLDGSVAKGHVSGTITDEPTDYDAIKRAESLVAASGPKTVLIVECENNKTGVKCLVARVTREIAVKSEVYTV
jgi:hypothetical protein